MSRSEFQDQLLSLFEARPFRPFIIELRDGEPIYVDDPMPLAFGEGRGVFIGADQSIRRFQHDSVSQFSIAGPIRQIESAA